MPLVLLICCSCAEKRLPVNISFASTYRGMPITCTDENVSLSDLRFFVSDVALVDATGVSHAVQLLRDDRWQMRGLALIDLENGQGTCINGTKDTRSTVRGTAEEGRFVELKFTIGVPFEFNHANPLVAEAPLDDAAMHWHWRSGYKFLRAGISTPDDSFWMHLGSTGCTGTVRNMLGCKYSNRVSVSVPYRLGESQEIAVEMSALIENVNLSDTAASDCSSGPSEPACRQPFNALGLDFLGDRGDLEQRVFRVLE